MLEVKNMHFGSSSDYLDPCGKTKPSYLQYVIRQGEANHLGCIHEAGSSQFLLFTNKETHSTFLQPQLNATVVFHFKIEVF